MTIFVQLVATSHISHQIKVCRLSTLNQQDFMTFLWKLLMILWWSAKIKQQHTLLVCKPRGWNTDLSATPIIATVKNFLFSHRFRKN